MAKRGPILVAVDFSNDSRVALQMADYQASVWGVGLVLAYIEKDNVDAPTKKDALMDWVPLVRHTPRSRLLCLQAAGAPAPSIVLLAEHFKAEAIFMGHGSRTSMPGPVAFWVKSNFDGQVELFSDTLAGLISG